MFYIDNIPKKKYFFRSNFFRISEESLITFNDQLPDVLFVTIYWRHWHRTSLITLFNQLTIYLQMPTMSNGVVNQGSRRFDFPQFYYARTLREYIVIRFNRTVFLKIL